MSTIRGPLAGYIRVHALNEQSTIAVQARCKRARGKRFPTAPYRCVDIAPGPLSRERRQRLQNYPMYSARIETLDITGDALWG